MKKKLFVTLLMGFCTLLVSAQTLPYQDASLSAAQRADDLLSRLTFLMAEYLQRGMPVLITLPQSGLTSATLMTLTVTVMRCVTS